MSTDDPSWISYENGDMGKPAGFLALLTGILLPILVTLVPLAIQ